MINNLDNLIAQNRGLKKDINILSGIGAALLAEKDTEKLLDLILINARQITQADSGSIYIAEKYEGGHEDGYNVSRKMLTFMLTQSDTIKPSLNQHVLEIDKNSIAGYVALTQDVLNIDDVYNLPADSPFGFNEKIDKNTGYHTKSMLVVPMSNQKAEIIGVLQLINKKRNKDVTIDSKDTAAKEVVPFEERDIDILSSLAGQAAVSLENSMLYREIQRLFKGFVKASVTAIESRDPTTSGHSERVAKLTACLAEKVSMTNAGPYSDVTFTRDQITEIEYASLLHDFGKVGVREHVLAKSNKLYEEDLELIKNRFALIKRTLQTENYKKKLDYIQENGKKKFLSMEKKFDEELEAAIRELDERLLLICRANKPTILKEEVCQKICDIARMSFENFEGKRENFLTQEEVLNLTIARGSLNKTERLDIESHVTHTYNFLRKIPWTRDMQQVPLFAYAHHERLNGSGYPRKIKAEDIPIQSRIIAISDIYDALTARDRPYKKAASHSKALDILKREAKKKKIDHDLLDIFIAAKVYEVIKQP